MRLLVADATTSVVALDDLRPLIEHGTLSVRLDSVAQILAGIRNAVEALTPPDSPLLEMDPVRQEQVAQIIVGVASAAGRLAAKTPDDPDAQQIQQALAPLHLS